MDQKTAQPEQSEPIRVLIADDQPIIRRALTELFSTEADIKVVAQAADGEEALRLARMWRPDVILMDLQMPRLGGVPATQRILAERPETKVVVLTTFDDDELVFEAISSGAHAYLLKDASEAEMLQTIRGVKRGGSYLSPSIAAKVMRSFRQLHRPAEPADEESAEALDTLSEREHRVLSLVAEGKSNREIAEAVFLAEGTVKNYVSRIMEKLHAKSRTELAIKTRPHLRH